VILRINLSDCSAMLYTSYLSVIVITLLYQRGTGVVCFSFFFWLRVLDKAEYSAFESTLNSTILSYRIVLLLLDHG